MPPYARPSLPIQVWKYPKVWEGFIKCCQRTKPQSFQVILQLPPQQLGAVFDKCPELREPLLAHVRSFTPHQVPRVWGGGRLGVGRGQPCSTREWEGFWRVGANQGPELPVAPTLLSPQQAHIPNSIMTILEASGKQEPEAKEPPAGPLEEVRVSSPRPPTQPSHLQPLPSAGSWQKGVGRGTAAPHSQRLSVTCLGWLFALLPAVL